MPKQIIAQQLKKAMGLHTPTVGMITISSAIKKRMRSLLIETYEQYQEALDSNAGEMKHLIEAVIIPETWFFRDAIAYKQLTKYLVKKKCNHVQNASPTIRILSIPCSTGEEPYSIAMSLIDNGFRDDEFIIDAVDISEKLIHRAREGIYGRNSFRADDLSFVKKYFTEKDGDKFSLSPRIKEKVNFHNANLMDDDFLPGYEIYDVIFCRNLLIYFDTDTQKKVFSTLDRLLKKDGILILGHAETSQKSAGLFETANELGAYINRKPLKNIGRQESKHKQAVTNHHHTIVSRNRPQKIAAVEKPDEVTIEDDLLETAFSLANQGHLEDAIKKALAYIENDRFSSRAHYLLGLLHDTNGDSQIADDYLKKSLYLDPNNIEALIHLSLMAEQSGDSEDSERLRNRAERVQQRNKTS